MRSPRAAVRGPLALAATAALALTLVGCGSSDSGASSANGGSAKTTGSTSAVDDNGVSQIAVTAANDDGKDTCILDHRSAPAGPVTFTVKNQSATGITEVELLQDQKILGEKESLAPGLAPVSFTLTLGGGDYQIYCPGGSPELVSFTVTGQASQQAQGDTQQLLQQGSKQYATYVDEQTAAMVTGVQQLQQAVDNGDLTAAQKAYANARIYYERIESDVDGFVKPGFQPTDNQGNLDYLVDMRATNLDPTVGWHGFHAVERDLFGRQQITASTKQLAAELTGNVTELSTLVQKLDYKPEDLANGAAGLLEEVQSNKISGEEEAFSHIDLVDFAGNVEGAEQCFAYLEPGLKKIDATLTAQIAQRFDAVTTLLDSYRDPNALGGYQRYTPALKKKDANTLSQSVQGLQDSLSRLAEKVATA